MRQLRQVSDLLYHSKLKFIHNQISCVFPTQRTLPESIKGVKLKGEKSGEVETVKVFTAFSLNWCFHELFREGIETGYSQVINLHLLIIHVFLQRVDGGGVAIVVQDTLTQSLYRQLLDQEYPKQENSSSIIPVINGVLYGGLEIKLHFFEIGSLSISTLLKDIGSNEKTCIFPTLELKINQQRGDLKDNFLINAKHCPIGPGQLLFLGSDATDHDLEATCATDLIESLHVYDFLEGVVVPPVKIKHAQGLNNLIERISLFQHTPQAGVRVSTAAQVKQSSAIAAREYFIIQNEASADTKLKSFISFLQYIGIIVVQQQNISQRLRDFSRKVFFKHFLFILRRTAPNCSQVFWTFLALTEDIFLAQVVWHQFDIWRKLQILRYFWNENFFVAVRAKVILRVGMWENAIHMIDAIGAIVHVVKARFFKLVIKRQYLRMAVGLRNRSWLLKSLLKHFVGPDAIQEMKFVQYFMKKSFSFH